MLKLSVSSAALVDLSAKCGRVAQSDNRCSRKMPQQSRTPPTSYDRLRPLACMNGFDRPPGDSFTPRKWRRTVCKDACGDLRSELLTGPLRTVRRTGLSPAGIRCRHAGERARCTQLRRVAHADAYPSPKPRLPLMSVAASSEIMAIATALLALGAIVTAWFAWRALRKQAEEVRTVEQQLIEQHAVNELQVQELQESLEERKRDRQLRHRTQASRVWFRREYEAPVLTHSEDDPSVPKWSRAVVSVSINNSSEQPVYDAMLSWQFRDEQAGVTELGTILPGETQARWVIDTPLTKGTDLATLSAVGYFRDAGGTTWQIRTDGQLTEMESRDVVRSPTAGFGVWDGRPTGLIGPA
jgi:hypothetical protein